MESPKQTYIIVLLLVASWCAGIVLAPFLASSNHSVSALLYSFFSPICHQIDHRSFHIEGQKLAVCIRCTSMYYGFFISLLLFPFVRDVRSPIIPDKRWLIPAMVPMTVDVLLSVMSLHPSTTLTRVVTGIALGSALPFFIVPPLLEAISQIRNRLTKQGGISYARKAE